jgi:hypothetical protein
VGAGQPPTRTAGGSRSKKPSERTGLSPQGESHCSWLQYGNRALTGRYSQLKSASHRAAPQSPAGPRSSWRAPVFAICGRGCLGRRSAFGSGRFAAHELGAARHAKANAALRSTLHKPIAPKRSSSQPPPPQSSSGDSAWRFTTSRQATTAEHVSAPNSFGRCANPGSVEHARRVVCWKCIAGR